MQAYCVKCRDKREMKEPKAVTMKNGRQATKVYASYAGQRCSSWERAKAGISVLG